MKVYREEKITAMSPPPLPQLCSWGHPGFLVCSLYLKGEIEDSEP